MAAELASDAEILERIEKFCEANNLPPSTFGRLALGDANLIPNLRTGRSLTLKSAQRILDFITSYRAEAA